VRDAIGPALAYVYCREDPAAARQANVLAADEARRIATTIARLPELLGKGVFVLRSLSQPAHFEFRHPQQAHQWL
jgi:hypothetical protein